MRMEKLIREKEVILLSLKSGGIEIGLKTGAPSREVFPTSDHRFNVAKSVIL